MPLAIPVVSGIGKTTLIHKASEALKSSGTPIDGFYTEEVRQGGKRIGFDVVTLSGKHGILARIGIGQSDGKHEYRVGQYVVDISSFEDFVLPTLDCMLKNGNSAQKSVCVIDEIGKMELFSQKLIFVVHKIFASSNAVVFGTIPVPKGKPLPLVEEIRHRQDVKVLNITKENRDTMLQEIVTTIRNCI
ncbi:PREDICTED: cancer-related nucleoside-triphosphatase [Nanorana parkeri]|uniref:cancer-related nucleoside-triphosphatase n=1 Tax=Nanorana parkeri TaxID=125878 RepID=UPI000854834E|nr:PREDICTED: cancer-related nucleoside-triphosphatase [Nanorana parkeri]